MRSGCVVGWMSSNEAFIFAGLGNRVAYHPHTPAHPHTHTPTHPHTHTPTHPHTNMCVGGGGVGRPQAMLLLFLLGFYCRL